MRVTNARLSAVASNLRVDVVTREVVQALRGTGISALLLKGPSIERWLYDTPGDRRYVDSDLLVAPKDRRKAQRVLRRLGFTPGGVSWLQQARDWSRDGGAVDLHTSLFGIGVPAKEAWTVLSRATETMRVGGVDIDILAPAARAFHLATHAAQHPQPRLHPTQDLARAITRLPLSTWEEAAGLARELHAEPTFVAGLRHVEGGSALADRLGLDAPPPAEVILLAGDEPSTAVGFAQISAARSPRVRLALLVHAIAPRPSVMRARSPLARRGPGGLAIAYITRLARLAWASPAGFRAWRRALRGSHEEPAP